MPYLWWLLTRPFVWIGRHVQIACGRRYVALHSGKQSKRRGFLSAGGEKRFCILPLVHGTIPYTLAEINDLTILCAWCQKPIFIGDYVTLYIWSKPLTQMPKGAQVHSIHPAAQVVGCQRDACCDTIADLQGHWVPNDERPGQGKVDCFTSVLERMIVHPRATHAKVTLNKSTLEIEIREQ
jgi:hypothetical protein